jgi:hypothetical protein
VECLLSAYEELGEAAIEHSGECEHESADELVDIAPPSPFLAAVATQENAPPSPMTVVLAGRHS